MKPCLFMCSRWDCRSPTHYLCSWWMESRGGESRRVAATADLFESPIWIVVTRMQKPRNHQRSSNTSRNCRIEDHNTRMSCTRSRSMGMEPADGEVAGHGGGRGDVSGVVMGESARRRDRSRDTRGRRLGFERARVSRLHQR